MRHPPWKVEEFVGGGGSKAGQGPLAALPTPYVLYMLEKHDTFDRNDTLVRWLTARGARLVPRALSFWSSMEGSKRPAIMLRRTGLCKMDIPHVASSLAGVISILILIVALAVVVLVTKGVRGRIRDTVGGLLARRAGAPSGGRSAAAARGADGSSSTARRSGALSSWLQVHGS